MKDKLKPAPVKIAAGLFLLIGVIWIIFSLITMFRSATKPSLPAGLFWILVVLMVGNGLLLIGTGWGVYQRRPLFYWFGLVWLLVNIILTFTDQFGFFDLVTLFIDLGIVGLLVFRRKQFYSREKIH